MLSPPSQRPIEELLFLDWAHLKSEFIWIYDGAVPDPYRNTRTHHPGQSALLMRRGTVHIENERGSMEARSGQWVFPRQGSRLQRFSERTRVLSVHFNLYWPGGQPLFDWDTAMVFDASAIPRLETRSQALCHLVERQVPGAAGGLPWKRGNLAKHLALQRAFASWLCVYADALLGQGVVPTRLGHVDQRVLDAVNTLDSLPVGVAFDEFWLASEVGLSPSQLDRLFSKQFKQTPRRYFEQRKLKRAMDLIGNSPQSIKQITYEIGFRSLSAFSRWFRQKTGHSPREFQESARSRNGAKPATIGN
jgi:AraC-like DNA-binding protein